MSTSTISNSVRVEQQIITKRFEEIDKFTAALVDERQAYVERSDTLQALLELYEHTERSIEAALSDKIGLKRVGRLSNLAE